MRNVRLAVFGLSALIYTYPPPAEGQTCVSDCNGDNQVAVNEIVTCVNTALGNATPSICPRSDPNNDGFVSIGELIAGVSYLLAGCPPRNPPRLAGRRTSRRSCRSVRSTGHIPAMRFASRSAPSIRREALCITPQRICLRGHR